MRLALSYPFAWPHVQRGGERLFADLSAWLASRGHEVTAITATPDGPRRTVDGTRATVELRPRRWPALEARGLDQTVTYLPELGRELRRLRPQVHHGMFHLDGAAARLAPRSLPVAIHVQGMPSRSALQRHRGLSRLFGWSLARADVVLAVSDAAAAAFEDEFGHPARAVLNGVDVNRFAGAATPGVVRSPEPTVLFPGAPDDPRKRLDDLVAVVPALRREWPGLRLLIAARPAPATEARLRDALGDDVEVLAADGPAGMAAAYRRAWVTCLPAVQEAFGLVFVESMACGTPAVGLEDAGVPEVVDQRRWLAPTGGGDGLAAAVDAALRDSGRAEVAAACLANARRFDWSVRGPGFEAVYAELT